MGEHGQETALRACIIHSTIYTASFSRSSALFADSEEAEKPVNGSGVHFSTHFPRSREERRMIDITRDKPIKVTVRVVVPVRDHPKFNFVGKLLGPKGNSLKRLQEETMTKMAILGRGSMRDKQKEEELRASNDPKFSHLNDDLHVEVTAFAPPAEAHARIAYALAEIRRFLVPDYNDEIRQEQMWEMQVLKNRQRSSGAECEGAECASSSASSGSPSPPPPQLSGSPPSGKGSPQQHPASRGVLIRSQQQPPLMAGLPPAMVPGSPSTATAMVTAANSGGSQPLIGRKRPLLSGGARITMSPTKRTVLSILTRARAAQSKGAVSPINDYDLSCSNGQSCRVGVLDENSLSLTGSDGGASAV
ncbi:Hypothetical predicted protein [Cloeon dipterum]|uniref:K Homology domain-containing protein n=1 Tax=Cloeon dipterum TaxID=197152 RepID=A0A8S1CWV4_9INSE|nr:Hypothetical predicted protein [Cloeon dipterum]